MDTDRINRNQTLLMEVNRPAQHKTHTNRTIAASK